MLYLLDANVLIDANRDYYPISRVPEFWDWLADRAGKHQTKIPLEMYEEILKGNEDDLTRWVKDNKGTLVLEENVDVGLVARVTASGYAPDLDDEEIQRLGRDPLSDRVRAPRFHATHCRHDRGLETDEETSKPPDP